MNAPGSVEFVQFLLVCLCSLFVSTWYKYSYCIMKLVLGVHTYYVRCCIRSIFVLSCAQLPEVRTGDNSD